MHSFTDFYKDVHRPWHLGLLYRKDRRLTSLVLEQLKKNRSIKVGINEPYKCNLKGDFSIPYFAELNGLPYFQHILKIKFCQDFLKHHV